MHCSPPKPAWMQLKASQQAPTVRRRAVRPPQAYTRRCKRRSPDVRSIRTIERMQPRKALHADKRERLAAGCKSHIPLPQLIYPKCPARITDPITTRINPPAISARCPTALPKKRPTITPRVTMRCKADGRGCRQDIHIDESESRAHRHRVDTRR